MKNNNPLDAIIIGGSYAGLSAAMALGRALRNVLIIDNQDPCNKQTPHSHNFITNDGKAPAAIAEVARAELKNYSTVKFKIDTVLEVHKFENHFKVKTAFEEVYTAKKIIFATGVKDIMPPIDGFAESWGISILHCPYCHGYEVRNEETGVLAQGDIAFEFTKMISNWTTKLTLFTNGKKGISDEQFAILDKNGILVNTKEIKAIKQNNGHIERVEFVDQTSKNIKALYTKAEYKQKCIIPEILGCAITEQGLIQVDDFKRTSVPGVYAIGDCTTLLRSVPGAVASGNLAGAMLNKELIEERFTVIN
ncbi:NAD(P)/FAD-dependent oxidoreductase [Flavobacterium sp. '19STA2R22 D10 B1']|uniref:NAD(P)/FAD-dependent oxidoreductase n=1 Tax=Flavobacterium aerium TaxID=3037261 RepID=UPI00278BEABF|nr:NAD(P)/FAD-dependent oxidoreductase [Flavobacterium sp. '19STA2R22 D10 B1']